MPIKKIKAQCSNEDSQMEELEVDLSSIEVKEFFTNYLRVKYKNENLLFNCFLTPCTPKQVGGNELVPYVPSYDYSKNFICTSERIIREIQYTCRKYSIIAADALTSFDSIVQFFQSLRDHETTSLHHKDKISFSIDHPNMTNEFYVPFMYAQDFTVHYILKMIENIIRSNQIFVIDDRCVITMSTCLTPRGGAYSDVVTLEDNYKKKSLIVIQNVDKNCAARAIVCGISLIHDTKESNDYKNIIRGRNLQTSKAIHLLESAGLPIDEYTTLEGIQRIEDHLKIPIFIVEWESGNNFIYYGNKSYYNTEENAIFLFKNANHFHCISKISAYFGYSYFCFACLKPYKDRNKHACNVKCSFCKRHNCLSAASPNGKTCKDCNQSYLTGDCFDSHKPKICLDYWRCNKTCRGLYLRKNYNEIDDEFVVMKEEGKLNVNNLSIAEKHQCGDRFCTNCNKMTRRKHRCYLQIKKTLKHVTQLPVAYFDMETFLNAEKVHHANLIVVMYADSEEYFIFNSMEEFYDWVLVRKHKDFTFIAHNLRGFDGQLIVKYMIDKGFSPKKVLANGNKLMSFEIQMNKFKVKFIDSLNFIAKPLSDLPKMFGFEDDMRKGFFPFVMNDNKPETMNFAGKLSDIPKKMFMYESMMPAKAREFDTWYNGHKEDEYDFRTNFVDYCKNDVYILRLCCNKFRKSFMKLTGLDVFRFVTISSACYFYFRATFLIPKSIPLYYQPFKNRYSKESIEWLEYIAKSENKKIRHALNKGEKYIARLKRRVDGYCGITNEVFEYLGCWYHSCKECFGSRFDKTHPLQKSTYEQVYNHTIFKLEELKSAGYNVRIMWSHEFDELKKEKVELKNFNLAFDYVEPLNVKDSIFGARTNAAVLYYEFKQGEKGRYLDFTSLYPAVAYHEKFPANCVAKRIYGDNIKNHSDISDYFGIIKCKVLPPKKLYFPVLPLHLNGKLIFTLCKPCAENGVSICNHSKKERTLIGTWTTVEMELAIQKGYKIVQIYEIEHFEKFSTDLFKGYVSQFLKLKQEASGYPDGVTSEGEKDSYIKDYLTNQGIQLDKDHILENKAMRDIPKIALNSLFGKFGQRDIFPQTEFIDVLKDKARFNSIVHSEKFKSKDVYLTDKMIQLRFEEQEKSHIGLNRDASIYISSFILAYGRIKLYHIIDKLGDKVLYFDISTKGMKKFLLEVTWATLQTNCRMGFI